jgi:hypothetical protein
MMCTQTKICGAFTILLAPCFVVACGAGESRWAGITTDSAGVTIVLNTDVGIWAPGEEWTLEDDLRIGAVDGSPEYQFGQVAQIAVDSKGRIFVLDGQAQHIQVYSPDGVYEQTIGARGGGPGELQAGLALLMGPGDTLLVPDGQNLRFNRYAPDGSSAGSVKMDLEDGSPRAFKTTASGVIAEQIRPVWVPSLPDIENPEDAIVLLANDGTVTDTLMTFSLGASMSSRAVTLFAPEPAWDITDNLQLLFGINDDYRITLYSDGQPNRIITKPFERQPIREADEEAIKSEVRRRWTHVGASAGAISRQLNRMQFADYFPAFNVIEAGPNGTTWVQHIPPLSELSEVELASIVVRGDFGGPDWDVFDAQGRFLGVVTMPPDFTLKLFRDDRIYGVWRDELDVQYVLRLRIVGDLGLGAT